MARIKYEELCDACRYSLKGDRCDLCVDLSRRCMLRRRDYTSSSPAHLATHFCKCVDILPGQPCRYYMPIKKESIYEKVTRDLRALLLRR